MLVLKIVILKLPEDKDHRQTRDMVGYRLVSVCELVVSIMEGDVVVG